MRIHKEGIKIILIIGGVLAILLVLLNVIFTGQTTWHYILYAASLIFYFFVIRFFRNPDRYSPGKHPESILSSADGRVCGIKKVVESEYFKDERIQLSIFMSIANVHVNYYPFNGIVNYVKYHPGKYMFAFREKASTDNERNSIVLKDYKGREVLIRQIAGGFARRIVCHAEEGMEVEQSQELGIIKFGSRVDFFLPPDFDIKVVKKQKVIGGRTVIGSFKD